MCSVTKEKGLRCKKGGGRHQRYSRADGDSESGEVPRSRSPSGSRSEAVSTSAGVHQSVVTSELGNQLLQDWSWGDHKGPKTRELAHKAWKDQINLLRSLGTPFKI